MSNLSSPKRDSCHNAPVKGLGVGSLGRSRRIWPVGGACSAALFAVVTAAGLYQSEHPVAGLATVASIGKPELLVMASLAVRVDDPPIHENRQFAAQDRLFLIRRDRLICPGEKARFPSVWGQSPLQVAIEVDRARRGGGRSDNQFGCRFDASCLNEARISHDHTGADRIGAPRIKVSNFGSLSWWAPMWS
jgi:hypothetical protein